MLSLVVLPLTVVTALGGCTNVDNGEALATGSTPPPAVTTPDGQAPVAPVVIPDDDTIALPDGFPPDLPRPAGGVIDASSAPTRKDGTPLVQNGPTDADWVFYAVPQGDVEGVATAYRAQLAGAGIDIADQTTGNDEIELTLARPTPTKVRITQVGGGVSVVLLVKRV